MLSYHMIDSYTMIYIPGAWACSTASAWPSCGRLGGAPGRATATLGKHYLSNATCLMRPRLFYAPCVVSRTIIICHALRHF